MKKFLSLVLALVMTMSLVTISAGAEFTDDTTVNYDEAVDVISALGIVGGYPDGSFKPQNTLTRGAAAKIICIMTLGADVAAALPTNVASYTDVPAGSTYAGYVAYLKNAGVISGYADGSYKPGVTLTGYAFLKMLLGALGYDQTIEGYVGENWQIAVAKRAKELKLFDDNKSFNGNLPATREEACLYALETLKAQPVKYSGGSTVTINGIAITTGADLEDDTEFDALYEKNFSKLTVNEDDTDAAGRPATSYVYDGEDVGTYAKSPKATYTASGVKVKDVYAKLGLTDTDTFAYYVDGSTVAAGTETLSKTSTDKLDQTINKDGVILEFYKSEKKIVVVNPAIDTVLAVTEADEDTDTDRYITLNDCGKTYTTEDFAEDDVVLVTYGAEVASVKTVEKHTGKITKISGNDVWVDGVKYTKSQSSHAAFAGGLKDEIDFYLDDAGYMLKSEISKASVSTSNMAFVEMAGGVTSGDYENQTTYKATLRYADGTSSIVTLKNSDSGAGYINNIVSFKVSSDKYVLTNSNDNDVFYNYSNATFTKGEPVLYVGTNLVVNSSTVFVSVDTDDDGDYVSTVYTGFKNAPTFGASNTTSVYAKDGKAVLVFVYGAPASSAADTAAYIVWNKDAEEIKDTDIDGYYETVMVDETGAVKKAVKVESDIWNGALSGQVSGQTGVIALDSYKVSTKGAIDYVDLVAGDSYAEMDKAASVVYKKGDEVVTIGTSTFTYDEKTVVYKVNDDLDEITATTIEKVADNKIDGKVYDSIWTNVTEKNPTKLAVVFMIAK